MAKKWNVYVTRMIPQEIIDELRVHCDVEVNPENRVLTKLELMQKVQGRDAVLSQAVDKIDAEVMDAAGPQCKIFANTPEVVTDATVEMTWALLFATARRIVESDRYIREGNFKGLDPMLLLGTELNGKILGVIGAGRIGRKFAMKAKAFDMKVVYHDVAPNVEFESATGAKYLGKDELLACSDFVSLHVPLLPETHHMMSAREFSLMKKTAFLINASRGPVVKEADLVAALKSGEIRGA
ncbi:D-glycerate dehydrogenase, partial [bacterium]|nr:D-glycerate dehydrogenase [bacterium]